jgi:hypothetical protein
MPTRVSLKTSPRGSPLLSLFLNQPVRFPDQPLDNHCIGSGSPFRCVKARITVGHQRDARPARVLCRRNHVRQK